MTTTTPLQTRAYSSSPCHAMCDRLAAVAAKGPDAVQQRLDELNREWTIGRWVKASCGLLLLVGVGLTALNPWWLALVAVAGASLVQYWFFKRSWLGEIFAAFGVRSGAVIEDERIALRVLRGDFRHLPCMGQIREKEEVDRMVGEGGPALEDDEDKYDVKEAAQLIATASVGERAS